MKQVRNDAAIKHQKFYFSSPDTVSFDINVYLGTSNTPLTTISGVKHGVHKEYNPGNGDNNITLISNNKTGIVLSNSGLRFESVGGHKFYVNYRGRSQSQAGSLTCKGQAALGTEFRWGGIPNRSNNNNISLFLGVMASEDNTTVVVSQYDTDCKFRLKNDPDGITDNSITVVLNKGQSYVLEALPSETTANNSGWLGALITSDKPIAISNGGMNVGVKSGSESRDVGIDQPVPVNLLGKEYVYVRALGDDDLEFPIIIATQPNTKIYVGSNSSPIETLDAGEYLEIPGSNYSSDTAGGNMFVRASKPVYAYQCLAAQALKAQTIGLNFLPPFTCLLPSKLDEIPAIDQIAGVASGESAVCIIASTTTPDADIVLKDGSGEVALLPSQSVDGTNDWKTFVMTNLIGEVTVTSTGPITVGTFMRYSNNAGLAGYFSGFDSAPDVEVELSGTGCYPGGLKKETTGSFESYQWYNEDGIIIGETTNEFTPDTIGSFYVDVTKGTCTYSSNNSGLYYCDHEILVNINTNDTVVSVGETVNFEIDIQNLSSDTITNLSLSLDTDSKLDFLSFSTKYGDFSNFIWTIGDLDPGYKKSISVICTVPNSSKGLTLNNLITHTQDQTDVNLFLDKNQQTVRVIDPLPVELTIFNAVKNDNYSVQLNWVTKTELNNDYYELYKSNDLMSWEFITKVKGVGNSNTENRYSYIDYDLKNYDNYYKLIQTDFDGSKKQIGLVLYSHEINSLNVYPTLLNNHPLVLSGNINKNETVIIFNRLGVIVKEVMIDENLNELEIDMNDFENGLYFLNYDNQIFKVFKY